MRKKLTKRNKEPERLTWEDIRAFLKLKLKREPTPEEIIRLLINRQHSGVK